jgi:hypothetical protein
MEAADLAEKEKELLAAKLKAEVDYLKEQKET